MRPVSASPDRPQLRRTESPEAPGRAPALRVIEGGGIEPLIAVKLWQNPCPLAFRINFLSGCYNNPVYDWIVRRFRLTRPQYTVLYALALKPGLAAKNIVAASAFPKNTVSRAISALLRRRLIRREADRTDRRSFVLTLTSAGRRIFDDSLQQFVAREELMLSALSVRERETLFELLARLILESPKWPTDLAEEK